MDVIRLLLRARANLVEQDSDVRSVRHTAREAGRQTDSCELDVGMTIFMSLLSFAMSLFLILMSPEVDKKKQTCIDKTANMYRQ